MKRNDFVVVSNYLYLFLGWADIGYSFLVGEDGNVYEGRGWSLAGAHCIGYNSKSIGRVLFN